VINGTTEIIAHIGFPTHSFKSPMIYNPYFAGAGINAAVVPMACEAGDYAGFLRAVFALKNTRGALITMPHKVSTVGLLDEVSPTAQVAGACNAVKRLADGRLVGDMFDGEGFVRGVKRKCVVLSGARALVVGCGGVGSAIAASLAQAGIGQLALVDLNVAARDALAARLKVHFPCVDIALQEAGTADPKGCQLVVNASPLGMEEGDTMPLDVSTLSSDMFVGEVVMRAEVTPFLAAARATGCRTQVGTDMLYEQIPAYLEYFGLPTTTPEHLRAVSQVRY
jgi:shikimate dehydrogenase